MRVVLITLAILGAALGGAEAASACSEPGIGKLPSRAEAGTKVQYSLTGMTAGSEYLTKVGGREVDSGRAENGAVSANFKMPDLGNSSRNATVEVVVDHDACENSPWKLDDEMRFVVAAAAPKPVARQPVASPDSQPAPSPQATTPTKAASKPAARARPSQPTKVATPTAAKPATTAAPKTGRLWTNPSDPEVRSSAKPEQPRLPASSRPVDDAWSTHALIALGIIFLLIAIGTGWGLIVLERKDAHLNDDGGEEHMVSHFGEPGEDVEGADAIVVAAKQPDAEPKAQAAEADTEPGKVPAPAPAAAVPAGVPEGDSGSNGHGSNGHGSNGHGSNGHGDADLTVVEAELEKLLGDAGLSAELEGIVAEVQAEAERQGIKVDPESVLLAILEGDSEAGAQISAPVREQLSNKFRSIVEQERSRALKVGS